MGHAFDRAELAVRGPRVLLAEDDDALRELLVERLALEGFDVTACATGADLLLHLAPLVLDERPVPFEVILTDVRMPGLTGLEVLEGLPGIGGPAAVIITAFPDERCQTRASRLPGADLLDKPFEMRELIALVRRRAGERAHPAAGSEGASVS